MVGSGQFGASVPEDCPPLPGQHDGSRAAPEVAITAEQEEAKEEYDDMTAEELEDMAREVRMDIMEVEFSDAAIDAAVSDRAGSKAALLHLLLGLPAPQPSAAHTETLHDGAVVAAAIKIQAHQRARTARHTVNFPSVIQYIKRAATGRRQVYGHVVSDVRALFAAVDADQSGSMSLVEFRAALERLDLVLSAGQLDCLMAGLDIDGDGEVQLPEFLNAFGMEGMAQTPAEAKVRAAQRAVVAPKPGSPNFMAPLNKTPKSQTTHLHSTQPELEPEPEPSAAETTSSQPALAEPASSGPALEHEGEPVTKPLAEPESAEPGAEPEPEPELEAAAVKPASTAVQFASTSQPPATRATQRPPLRARATTQAADEWLRNLGQRMQQRQLSGAFRGWQSRAENQKHMKIACGKCSPGYARAA